MKKTCELLNAHDSFQWELGEGGVLFSYYEALEEAKIANAPIPSPWFNWFDDSSPPSTICDELINLDG